VPFQHGKAGVWDEVTVVLLLLVFAAAYGAWIFLIERRPRDEDQKENKDNGDQP